MNTRKFANYACFVSLGIIAALLLLKFLGQKVFGWSDGLIEALTLMALYLGAFATMLSAYAFAKSRRSQVYFWLLLLFVAVIVVFSFIL